MAYTVYIYENSLIKNIQIGTRTELDVLRK